MRRIFNYSQTPLIREKFEGLPPPGTRKTVCDNEVSVKLGSIVQRKDLYEKINMRIHLLDSADGELLCISVCIFQGHFIRPRL